MTKFVEPVRNDKGLRPDTFGTLDSRGRLSLHTLPGSERENWRRHRLFRRCMGPSARKERGPQDDKSG
jgi:hypothetical protein